MDINYRQLKAFIILAEKKSFTAAAKEVHVTQSALSQMIKKLTAQMEDELLLRSGRSIELTDSGTALYEEAKVLVTRLEKLRQENKNRAKGYKKTLVIASLYSVCATVIPPTLSDLKAFDPEFTFRLMEQRTQDITQSVLNGVADLGINTNPYHPDIEFIPIYSDYLCLICHQSHPLSSHIEVTWEQVHQHANIGVSLGNTMRSLTDLALSDLGFDYQPEFSTSHASTLLGMVKSGLGAGILTTSIERISRDPELRYLKIVNPVKERELGILRNKFIYNPLIEHFMRYFKQNAAKLQL